MPINKVLFIDDDPILRATLQQYFENRGVGEILSAKNGLEALGVLREHQASVDLLVSDLNMPTLDGVELLEEISGTDYRGPIVIVSGTYDVVRQMAKELGERHNLNITGMMTKPFDPVEMDRILSGI